MSTHVGEHLQQLVVQLLQLQGEHHFQDVANTRKEVHFQVTLGYERERGTCQVQCDGRCSVCLMEGREELEGLLVY